MERPTIATSCCTTPSALCFWGEMVLVIFGAGLLLEALWPTMRPYNETLIFVAMGAACLMNYGRNRTLHCVLTGPAFLIAAFVTALSESQIWHVNLAAVWCFVLAVVVLAFIVEWRTVGGQRHTSRPTSS